MWRAAAARWAGVAGAAALLAGCGGGSGPEWLAFTSTRDGNAEVYYERSDGTGLVNLSQNLANDGQPSWSPDGKRIAFTSTRDLNGEIYVMNADGRRQRRVTDTKKINDTAPVWSPNGEELAFMCTDAKPVTQICVAGADGGHPLTLTNGRYDNLYPVWTPDSSAVLFVSARPSTHGQYAIYAAPAGGGPSQLLASAPGGAGEPAYSPDGKAIAFIRRSSATAEWRLAEMNADGTGARPVPAPPGRIDGPEWSPDGKRLVFSAVGAPPRSRSDLWVENADGSDRIEITHGPGDSTAPEWSPNGGEIAFERVDGSHVDIDVVEPDGTGERKLTSGQGKNGGPVWRP